VGVMTAQRPGSPMTAARLLGIIQWVLPLALAGIAVFFEWSEHIAREQEPISAGFIGEIILFAVVGPVAVFMTLVWVSRLLRAYAETSAALAAVNHDLEDKVAERTAHLEEATAQLAATNADLAHANAELRQLDRLKSEFVSLVSHQLRAPLTNIRGALEIMTILDVSRLEAGRLSPRLGLVAIEPLLARACASTLGADPGRPWSLEVQPGLPPAWADETLVEEVIRNLLENSANYSPASQPVLVQAANSEAGIRIAVTDHGQGVPPEEHELIFQSFHRIGDDDTTVQGYGLGLYFVDRLVRAMGGSVAIESPVWPDAAAPGSRFTVTLPLAEDGASGPDDGSEDA
jgi:signal transduction histidine kinase